MQTRRSSTAALTLLALGVVYGDIGTSPLYAVKETFAPAHGIPLNEAAILGGLSTMFWILMISVSLKYVTLVMRADNKGEGGIMALLALASGAVRGRPGWRAAVLAVGAAGAALFFGEAVLTPAISVLSAVEGLHVGDPVGAPDVVPIAAGVLAALFLIQRHGTGAVGRLFGPVCLAWFAALAAAGLWNVVRTPQVLAALNPLHALAFVTDYGFASFVVLGSVLLAITGAEALYADMGHFGKRAVRIAWFGLVAPALVLNYFGQGALLLRDPLAIANPFYLAFPAWALYPMVALATAATVIASQAVISGAYSVTQQAIQLGFLPRLRILHTSAQTSGQIYVPAVNWLLFVAVLAVVTTFGSSAELAQAYGVAVMGTMLATTFLTFFVVRFAWGLPLALCLAATGFFFAVESTLLASALLKVFEGGWLPLAIGAVLFALMLSWRRGRLLLLARLRQASVPLDRLLESLMRDPPLRVPGTAVFFTSTPDVAPNALLHNLNHNKVLHERVVFLTVEVGDEPAVPPERRIGLEQLEHGFWKMTLHYGFMQRPDVTHDLTETSRRILEFDLMSTTFFLSRQMVVPSRRGALPVHLSERLFAALSRGAGGVIDYFNLPPNRVIELGTKVQL
ncbi:MAG: potassium transporter Kup [Betaproteobacteria bacterium]|nr:potassium transporter Kup [Betaproteobacteria bacterium]